MTCYEIGTGLPKIVKRSASIWDWTVLGSFVSTTALYVLYVLFLDICIRSEFNWYLFRFMLENVSFDQRH